ncbi:MULTISPECIES: type VII secretion-associated serine protease mycosin [Micromonospora]|uniref:type VII secretion-associated serine protease mycosin n=1 Tax=Micromonospora TaxID=1873 RepID=UPI00068F2001|nr:MULTISPECIES: type VII secretion-associated serine protease mycosin [Micromonospora]OHX04251.1 type VII secretion-associated serine protease mycosin [Micromonospora sp. WMMB235]
MNLSLVVRLASACLASSVLAAPAAATAPNVRQDQWHLRFLNAAAAQAMSEGEGVTVAVPDTGIDPHPDLRENLLAGTDLSSEGDGRQDRDGHGTSMAGLIAAHGQRDNSGALGVAPRAKLLPIRTRLVDGRGSADELAASVEWAVANHADVISISAVAGATSRLQGAIRSALKAEIVVVAAVGNQPEDPTVGYPASEPGVIGVGGIDRSGLHAPISATGPEIDLVAPAVDIYSTSYDGKYSKGTGTSSATAIVAGAAALIRSKYPNLPAQEVAHRLTATAVDKGPPGRDDQYGYGVIDLVAALTADVPPLGFESSNVTPPASAEAAPDKGDDGSATVRGLATLGVLVAAGGGYLFWRRRRRADDPPPRVSR